MLALIAFGIAAVQLVPAIEYQQLSTREALSFADAAKGFPTLDILQFILPGYASAFASPLYVGILPLWLAIFALLRKRNETSFWGLLALGALLLSFGFYVFAYVIFYLFVPGASLFRQQERLAFVVSFALAMLAGYGMTDLLGAFDMRRARKLFVLLPVGAVIMLMLLLVFFVAGALNPEGRLAFLGDRAGLMLIQFALASLLVGLYLKGFLPARWFAVLAIILILFDLWSVNEPANKGRVEERFADIPFAQQLPKATGWRIAADEQLLPGHFGIAAGLQDIDGISPLRLARYDKLLQLPNAWDWLNVMYVITKQPQAVDGNVIAQEGAMALVRVTDAKSRVWVTQDVVLEQDDERARSLLAATKWSRLPRSEIIDPQWHPERITLDVSTPADALLVFSENYYPGWRATVDGQPTEILRANLTLRAIPVRAGQHHIEMWYDPLSFKLGAVVSALTLLGCIGALFWLRATNTATVHRNFGGSSIE
ncbi:MAG: YfhO family protein [Anaerolineales bacterium]|nr:YfhO family protein [Anaerolineales bacterium]